jgi:hypothetical protein
MASNASLTAILFCSLIFSSFAVSYFVVEMGISEKIPQIAIPLPEGNFKQSQNFLSSSSYQAQTFKSLDEWDYINGVGLENNEDNSYLLVKNLNFDANDIIQNRYVINNSLQNDYGIVISYTGGKDQNILFVQHDGFHIRNVYGSSLLNNDYVFIPYIDANKFSSPIITTTYNKKTHILDWTLNSASFRTTVIPEDANPFGVFERYYGGVTAFIPHSLVLQEFSSSNGLSSGGSSTDGLAMLSDFFSVAITVLLWTLPESIFPLILNIILIKTQLIGLLISFIYLARG